MASAGQPDREQGHQAGRDPDPQRPSDAGPPAMSPPGSPATPASGVPVEPPTSGQPPPATGEPTNARLPRPPVSVWISAARPRTLPAAVVPVLVGTAVAQTFSLVRFLLALLVGLSLQVAVNYANDYFDGVRGVDRPDRLGPTRAVAGGLVTPGAMRLAMIAALAVAVVCGLTLGALAGWGLVAVGAVAILAALGYSGGPRPYASAGLGELFVFVFFGLVATAGSTYVQDEVLSVTAIVAACTPGFMAVALLVVNNLRDIPTDRAAGKRTLSVRIGDLASRRLIVGCLAAAFVPPVVTAVMTASLWPILPLAALPLAVRLAAAAGLARGRALLGVLTGTGRLHLTVGVLYALGLWAA